jgi:ABC-type oligopeptide transport system ATPase subunit
VTAPVAEVEGLTKHFRVRHGLLGRESTVVRAVDGVTLSIAPGETLCLVGESGCGKSTVGRLILRLLEPTAGQIRLHGIDVTHLGDSAMRPHRRHAQMVFQDPYASLNPRLSVGTIVGEPLENYDTLGAVARRDKIAALLERVGLRAEAMRRYAFEFSGGQRQRLGIARALALDPGLIVADEAVSALDVSVQAQVLKPADGPAGRARHRLSVHFARSRRGRTYWAPHRGDVSRRDRRTGPQGRDLRRPDPSLHRSPDCRRPDPRPPRAD